MDTEAKGVKITLTSSEPTSIHPGYIRVSMDTYSAYIDINPL